ncbi:MAG: amidohydrolase family protein, partial [Chloroflexota bacterium]|nr:amidohydrolase family protein [Chloroflexota bacterium]
SSSIITFSASGCVSEIMAVLSTRHGDLTSRGKTLKSGIRGCFRIIPSKLNFSLVEHKHMAQDSPLVETNDLDRRIWNEELDEFVPREVYDIHTHMYRWAFNTDPDRDSDPSAAFARDMFPEAGFEALQTADNVLMPGRRVNRLSFPFPFAPRCDFEASNRWVAEQTQADPESAALMMVHPSMTTEDVEADLDRYGFLGFKPYLYYSATGDTVQCRITDFLPKHQLAVADRRGLMIMMHLSRRQGIADDRNLEDLSRLTADFPNVKWILAHCARSYSYWALERAAARLREIPNLWYETSSVCESDAIEALFEIVGPDRVMYGSDDLPVGAGRGKYISFGQGWGYLSPTNHSVNLDHCDERMTFVRYEQLRAMRRAAKRVGLGREQIEDLFRNTARSLVRSVRGC